MSHVKANPAVDAYIDRAPDFAQPILEKIRKAFHKASPQLEETIKWGVPYFEYRGLVGGMAAFKQHVGFGLWKSKQLDDPEGLFKGAPKASMCTTQVTHARELPTQKVLVDYIRRAVALNEAGDAPSPRPRKKPIRVTVPDDLARALARDATARRTFEDFAPSYRRDYVEWLTEAKTQATRERRLATTLEWLAEGKPRNWKYDPKYR